MLHVVYQCHCIWFLGLTMCQLYALNYAFVHICQCSETQPLSRHEFLQSATLPLICTNQGAPLVAIFTIFSVIQAVLLLSFCNACKLKSSQEKTKRQATETQKHNCPLRVITHQLHSLISQETLRHVNMPYRIANRPHLPEDVQPI